jgi:hypothetical protein
MFLAFVFFSCSGEKQNYCICGFQVFIKFWGLKPDPMGCLANKGYYPLFDDFSLSQGIVGARYIVPLQVYPAHLRGLALDLPGVSVACFELGRQLYGGSFPRKRALSESLSQNPLLASSICY